jgi:alkylhydroperoxidase family enzyme
MTSTPRLPKAEITSLSGWLLKRLSRKHLGEVPEAVGVMWHNRAVLFTSMGFGRKVEKWDQLDRNLKTYAHMAVASLIGCSWCLDFNYFKAYNEGLDEAKASEVPRWRESTVFTPLERDVMEYAEAMSGGAHQRSRRSDRPWRRRRGRLPRRAPPPCPSVPSRPMY